MEHWNPAGEGGEHVSSDKDFLTSEGLITSRTIKYYGSQVS